MPYGVLRMDHPFDCGAKRNKICGVLKLPQRLPNPILFALYGRMMPLSLLKRKNLLMAGFLNMWSFGGWGCAKMKPIQENLIHTWIIGKKSLIILLSKLLPIQNSTFLEGFWPSNNRKFNHMRGLIPSIVTLIMKTRLSFCIVVLKTCDHHWRQLVYTPFWDLGIGNFVLVKLADPKLYLVWIGRVENEVAKDQRFNIFNMFIFNGGCQWKKKTRNDR